MLGLRLFLFCEFNFNLNFPEEEGGGGSGPNKLCIVILKSVISERKKIHLNVINYLTNTIIYINTLLASSPALLNFDSCLENLLKYLFLFLINSYGLRKHFVPSKVRSLC